MEMEGLLFQFPTIYQVDGFRHDCFLDTVQKSFQGFPGGTVVENLPANAGDMGSIPGMGGSHMPRSN